jgi:hypothetical protein
MFTLTLLTAGLLAGAESKLTLEPGWKAVRTLPSDHAHQAAAADGTHFFAISSTRVAVYDRHTAELLAVSDGPAAHLNSGFVHEGKVYCAHSNFPKKPETSDIRVYDPATNKLSVFHEFKDPPGSLVWCVVNDGRWWCCFAHYGTVENAKTVLIQYADGFRETGRWRFPKVVVDDWDKMSASGGVWDGDVLLVTHHHFKVIYRLRLPKSGAELEFLDARTSPFPGQGIAVEPKTGGLIGIDRTAKSLVIAERVTK